MSDIENSRCVIDVGNTTIATALFIDGQVHFPERISTDKVQSSSDVEKLIQNVRDRTSLDFNETVVCVGVSRVRDLLEKYGETNAVDFKFVSGVNLAGAKVIYETPETLGPDRIANTIGAAKVFSQPTLVIDCGTAINIDLIDVDGNFVGGMICPGLETQRDGLTHFAPSLPEVPLVAPEDLIGTSTIGCIQSGILNGSAAMIDSIASRLSERYSKLKVVITGGFSSSIFPLLTIDAEHDEWLTLKGLGFAEFE